MALGAQQFGALVVFAFVTSITPGPNNLMLLASGVNFGFRRTIPHMLGIFAGFTTMVALVGLGIGAALTSVPALHFALKWGGLAYMLWLAWSLLGIGKPAKGLSPGASGQGRPMRFIEAAAFQWVNPKAWMMALGATAAYVPAESPVAGSLFVALAFGLVNLPSVSSWAAFGAALRDFLSEPKRLRVFNWVMAALLVASLAPMLRG